MSTVGDSPETVIVSVTLPTSSFALIVATNAALMRDVGRLDGPESLELELDAVVAGRQPIEAVVPVASVVCVCTPPISRSPESDTRTPGNTAPLLSVTAPTIDPVCTCALGRQQRAGTPNRALPFESRHGHPLETQTQ